ncbi:MULTISPECIES: phage minor head protein [unclassified Burkholderia]|uniref:phage head morphogenesis protein n=1 Tax=unclassified Burkholderia TaxID=2613784 RepID=UPI000F55E100|nr:MULTISPECIES: phage minor head protein [unclassified Burkholderia]RQR87716.1 phage head morphogenesis protein [Burkholderia sp. Bp9011]RQR97059.1 phage head morphogenesis protein [Burkholderia sp. Bp9010]
MTLTLDRKRRNPVKTQRIEQRYALQLRKVAEQVGSIISPFTPGDMSQVPMIEQLLKAYSDMLKGWATQTASNMLMDVALRDEQAWQTMARELSQGLREEIRNAPTGRVMRQLLADQVDLIQSIPIEAAQRVHRLTLEGLENSARASEIAKEIQNSTGVATSRAVLIARTEVARTSTTLTQARAESIGADSYIWRTSGDGAVRSDHRELNGKIFQWNNPPVADKRSGERAHPGCIYNCRCWAEPIIPD